MKSSVRVNQAPTTPRSASSEVPRSRTTADLAHLFKLLSDETRLRIVVLLFQNRELNVRSLCGLLGYSQPAVSHPLALLKVSGLIACRREGKHNYYYLLPLQLGDLAETILGISIP